MPRAILVLFLAVLPAFPAMAATFTVNSTADAVDANPGDGICATATGACTLRAAVMEANQTIGPHTINVPAGTYTFTIAGNDDAGAAGDLDLASDIHLLGAGAASTIINAASIDRVIDVAEGQLFNPTAVTIEKVTLRNGLTTGAGGGIRVQNLLSGINLTLLDVILLENTAASRGGGFANESNTAGPIQFTNVDIVDNAGVRGGGLSHRGFNTLRYEGGNISGNTASEAGGGVTNGEGRIEISDVTIDGNQAALQGGGVHNPIDGSISLLRTIVENNTAGCGGGIAVGGIPGGGVGATLSTIRNNTAGVGGGICNGGAAVNVFDTSITGNRATSAIDGGGGVWNNGRTTLTRTTVSGNTSDGPGGGVLHGSDTLTISNSTISGNTAATEGGGIASRATATIDFTTIAGNTAPAGANIDVDTTLPTITSSIIAYPNGSPNCSGGLTSGGGNVASDNSCSLTQPSDQPSTDPLLGPLQDNGGPTETHEPLAGSPAIDAAAGCIATDQRGALRPEGPACDSGSVEAGASLDADLELTKTDSPDPATVGEDVLYSLAVHNAGPLQATGITVVDQLPANGTFVSATSSEATCVANATTVTCTIPSLNANDNAAIDIVVTATAAGMMTNSATVTANENDPDPADNAASATTTVNPSPAVVAIPTLSFAMLLLFAAILCIVALTMR